MARADAYRVDKHTDLYFSGASGANGDPWQRRLLSAAMWMCTLAYIGLFIGGLFTADWQLAPISGPSGNPLVGLSRDVLVKMGATAAYKISGGSNQWWRLWSSQFVCAGTLHIWACTSSLWTFGLFLSSTLSAWQLVVVFLLSGTAGATASANIAGDFITSAASGPIFGLIGGTCAALLLHWRLFRHLLLSWATLVIVLCLNLYMGATPFVDNVCNTVGFVAGAMTTLAFLLLNRRGMDSRGNEWLLRLACVVLLGAAISISVVGVIGLSVDPSPVQGCCNKWSCIPSPLWDCDAARVRLVCQFETTGNGTSLMYCPAGSGGSGGSPPPQQVPKGLSSQALLELCDSACSGAVSGGASPSSSSSPSASPGASGGGGKDNGI